MKEKKKSNFIKMISMYKEHMGMFSAVMFGVVLTSAIDLFWPILTKYMLNAFENNDSNMGRVISISVMIMLGLIALNIFSQYLMSVTASVLTDRIKYGLQKKIFSHYMYMSFSYFDNARSGSMITMLNYDVDKIDQFMYTVSTRVIKIVLTTIGAAIIFTTVSWKISCMLLPLVLLIIIFNKLHGKRLTDAFAAMRDYDSKRMEEAEDKIAGVRTVIASCKEYNESLHFNNMCDEAQRKARPAWVQTWIRNIGNILFNDLYYVVLLGVGGIMLMNETLKLSDLTLFLMYSYMITEPVNDMIEILKFYHKANASYRNIDKFLNIQPDIEEPKHPMKPDMTGPIVFNKCKFAYEASDDTILDELSVTFSAGKHTAIVGPSGSGKSTIAGLIPRFYDVKEGTITIGGVNVKDISLSNLRQNVAIVQQDIYLFYGSIYENIIYGLGYDPGTENVISVAKMANVHEFVSELPNGYNTCIGDRGVKLSGGQKQRIAIARALLSNPMIIIFDEATSALDNESEKEVQKAMDNIAGTRTMITIAHRLSTIKNADEILYLTKNGIEERGTHAHLMEMNGQYAKLYNASLK